MQYTQSSGEEGLAAQAEPQGKSAPRPSLSEINAIVKGLQIHALGRADYGVLLDGGMSTRRAQLAARLTVRRRRRVIAPHRLPAWWAAVTTEPDYARDLLLMVLFTGIRQSKVASLRWDHVDLVGRALYFPQMASGRWFGLPMSDFLAELIGRRRRTVASTDWVFPGRGRAGHIAYTQSMVRRVAGKSAVPFAFYDLRRTFIAVAASLEVPPDMIKRLLGHRVGDAAISSVGSIAGEVERLRDPAQRIADRILSLVKAHQRRRGLLIPATAG